jgi:hypothetical protein
MTRGTCRISYHEGRVTNRQIHLCLDSVSGRPTALGHEITHVVFADHFSERHLPRWADEGIAMLSDLPEKKEMFRRAVRRAIENRSCLTLTRVLQERDYPASSRMPVFYSQSLSLVEFLAELDAPARILDFVRLSQAVGYEDAVRRVYRLESMAELERLWRDRTSAGLSTGI